MNEINIDAAVDDIASGLGIETSVEDTPTTPDIVAGDGTETLETNEAESTTASEDSTAQNEETDTTSAEDTAVVEGTEEEQQVSSPSSSTPAPDTWRPDAAKEWEKLPPVVQQEILKREKDITRGIEGYRHDATIGKHFQDILKPYVPLCQKQGVDPMQQVQYLMHAHQTLLTKDPAEKYEIFHQLAASYGIDLNAPAPYVDPQLKAVQKELAEVKSRLNNADETAIESTVTAMRQELEAFASAPENEHFDLVIDDMTALIRAGKATNLREAYDQAIWLHPQVRSILLERQAAERDAARQQQEANRVKLVKKATGANVTTTVKNGSPAAPVGTMDDTLQETLAAIKARV